MALAGISGTRVAVTGAAGGIGSAICERLAAEGAHVFALDQRKADAGEWVEADVTSADSMATAALAVAARGGGVDGLVACAGTVEDDVAAEEMEPELFDQVIGVNLRGVFLACREFGRAMLEAGRGRIVNVSSMSGNEIVNFPQRQCAYNASKAGVSALTRSLAVEWGPRGVRVNSISPGYVDTPLLALKQHQHDIWKKDIVLGRFATPAEIAGSTAWLLSDDAEYCCGTDLLVDGGFSLR